MASKVLTTKDLLEADKQRNKVNHPLPTKIRERLDADGFHITQDRGGILHENGDMLTWRGFVYVKLRDSGPDKPYVITLDIPLDIYNRAPTHAEWVRAVEAAEKLLEAK